MNLSIWVWVINNFDEDTLIILTCLLFTLRIYLFFAVFIWAVFLKVSYHYFVIYLMMMLSSFPTSFLLIMLFVGFTHLFSAIFVKVMSLELLIIGSYTCLSSLVAAISTTKLLFLSTWEYFQSLNHPISPLT